MNSGRIIVSKWQLIVVLVAIGAGIFFFLVFNQDAFQETTTKYFRDYETAKSSGIIEMGWLPDFLPQSAKEIYEKHNFDYNRGIIAFSCSRSDLSILATKLESVSTSKLTKIAPSWLVGKEPWFPNEIVRGEFAELSKQGFTIYGFGQEAHERIVNGKIQTWYVAINFKTNYCFIWH